MDSLKGDSATWGCPPYIVNGQHGWYQISIRGPVSVSWRAGPAAAEARSFGRGGIRLVSEITGGGAFDHWPEFPRTRRGDGAERARSGSPSWWRVQAGDGEATGAAERSRGAGRAHGAGRYGASVALDLEELPTPCECLKEHGFSVSRTLVGKPFAQLGYTSQGNAKTREGTDPPDRDGQFETFHRAIVNSRS